MPFLDWVNKNQAKETTREVPYHLLKQESMHGDVSGAHADNLLIQGDNLLALKALIPFYAGRVKCIFIDPPYNTQSAFEHYDDKLEHSQWLSMMYPRLVLLRELLTEDGSIWITIDDNEAHYLKVLMDEIFGRKNFVGNMVWQKRYSRENRASIGGAHDHVLTYAKINEKFKSIRNLLPLGEKQTKIYKNPNNDPRGKWRAVSLSAQGYRPNQMYVITAPTGKQHRPPAGSCWKVIETNYHDLVANDLIYFGKDGNAIPSRKQFLNAIEGMVPWTWWPHEEAGHNDEAKREVQVLFGADDAFGTPKPERLIERVLTIATNHEDLVLDSFLGSGTTAAVAHKMGRRYIGIEMGDHARTHCHIELPQAPDTQHWPEELKQAVRVMQTTQGATVLLHGEASSELLAQAEVFISNAMPPKAREKVKEQFDAHRAVRQAMRAPAQLGLEFAAIPQLCLTLDGHLELVERETLSGLGDWSLLGEQVQLAGFGITETVNSFEIDVNGAKVTYRHTDAQQLLLNETVSHTNQQDLVRWLDVEVRQSDIGQAQMQAYLVKMLTHLTADRGFTLTALVRARFQLAQALAKEVGRLRQIAMARGFQGRLMDMAVPSLEQMVHYSFHYQPGQYPARNLYQGSYEFSKHFYPVIHDLREKTQAGAVAEEFRCAQAVDAHATVKQWVRNIERQEKFSFWLPTATDYFYPDFVAELTDGRLLAVEYKGEHYKTNDDSREKKQVGHRWEQSSGGRCLFLFAVARDDQGRDVFQQLANRLVG